MRYVGEVSLSYLASKNHRNEITDFIIGCLAGAARDHKIVCPKCMKFGGWETMSNPESVRLEMVLQENVDQL